MNFNSEIISALPKLRNYARSLTHNADRAEDLVQDVVVKILQAQHQFTPGTNFMGWCVTIMRNHFYSNGRRKKIFKSSEEIENFAERYPVAENVSASIELTEVLAAIDTIALTHRKAIELRALEFTYDEIADRLNTCVGTAKSRVGRARKALLEELGA